MSSDPTQFPDRPDHADFYMLSDAVITIERQMHDLMEKGLPVDTAANVLTGPFVDIPSFDYMALNRMLTIESQLPFPANMMLRQIRDLVAGIWQDGFMASLYYQERKANGQLMVVPDTIEGLDEL